MIHLNSFHDYVDDATGNTYEDFLSMTGEVVREKTKIEIWKRKGVGGIGLRDMGKKGEEFRITTHNLIQSFADANNKMDVYHTMIGRKYQLRMQSGSGTFSYGDVFVLDVKLASPVVPTPLSCAVIPLQFRGTTTDNPTAAAAAYVLQELEWTLISTPQTSTEPEP